MLLAVDVSRPVVLLALALALSSSSLASGMGGVADEAAPAAALWLSVCCGVAVWSAATGSMGSMGCNVSPNRSWLGLEPLLFT